MRIRSPQHLWKVIKNSNHVVRAQLPSHMLDTKHTIAFRGDTRRPEEIFKTGFKVNGVAGDTIIRYHPSILHTHWESGICLSSSFKGATFFPDQSGDNYIYIIKNPVCFDTGNLIAQVLANAPDMQLNIRERLYRRDLAFEELTARYVSGKQILMAVHLTDRTLAQSSIDWDVSFNLSDYTINPKLSSKEDKLLCRSVIKSYPLKHYQFSTQELSATAESWLQKYGDNGHKTTPSSFNTVLDSLRPPSGAKPRLK